MRQQMNELGYAPDPSPAVLHFLTARLNDKESADIRKAIPRKDLAEAWRDLEDNAKDLAKRLSGKEAATPSRTWKFLSSARQEMVLFLAVTARQQAVAQKIKNFFTKWRQVQQKIPLPEMTELLITPQLPEYPKIADEVFMLLLDGKLRSRTEILKFLKPLAPPPPPPPPPPRRGRGAKAALVQAPAQLPQPAAKKKGKDKDKGVAMPAAPAVSAIAAKGAVKGAAKGKSSEKPATVAAVATKAPVGAKSAHAKSAKPAKPVKKALPKKAGAKSKKAKKH
jgi:hypothetical protein